MPASYEAGISRDRMIIFGEDNISHWNLLVEIHVWFFYAGEEVISDLMDFVVLNFSLEFRTVL